MTDGKSMATTRWRGWVKFVLALWAIALLLLGLQAAELSLFERMGG